MATNTTKLLLPGRQVENVPPVETDLQDFLDVEVLAAQVVDANARGTQAESVVEIPDAAENDVIEIEFDNGLRQWVSVAQLRADLALGAPATSKRGERGGEFAAAKGELVIPSMFARGDVTRGGLGELVVKGIKLLRTKLADEVEDQAVKLGAKGIAELLERKLESQLNPEGPGVYHFGDSRNLTDKITDERALNSKEPHLLFLHGTASSSVGSFGQLGVLHSFDQLGLMNTPEWEALRRFYQDRILAYEHRTLSQSPLQNAIEVASALPENAKLHLVSHSRGGLVGELLCLGQVKQLDPNRLAEPFKAVGRDEDVKLLQELLRILLAKRFQVQRFVRVACPARGTTLASKRLDLYLSGLLNLMNLVPALNASPTFKFVKATLLQVAKLRTDPKQMPGLEAMMPESPFIFMLNGLDLATQADLAVIAGDVEGGDLIDRMKMLLPDAFYREQNDLIVNTSAMSGGMKREPNGVLYFDQGPEVNHFNYFSNHNTRIRLLGWLGRDEADPKGVEKAGFKPLPVPAPIVAKKPAPMRGVTRAQSADTPIVFLLPGIMGSHLEVKGNRVWLNRFALALGGMRKLKFGTPQIKPNGVVGSAYQRVMDFLAERYEVVEFPYDWRLSLAAAAEELAKVIQARLGQPKRAIRLLAHSMGGLVARTMIANHPDVWDEVRRRDGRLVMLGTPNRGSFVIPRLFAGQEKILGQLALLDLADSKDQIISIIMQYPGLVDMLPEEFFAAKTWDDLKFRAKPIAALLAESEKLRRRLNALDADKERMIYVAGSAPSTPSSVRLVNGAPVFNGTTAGDGRVTYDLGLLNGVKTWYVDAEHGELANHEPSFPALFELLDKGATDKLSTVPKVQRGLMAEHVLREEEPQAFPNDDELAAAALGSSGRQAVAVDSHTLQISVVKGDLRYASYPIAVGHYKGDLIVGAEKAIDKLVANQLSRLVQIGLYPGDEGTAEVVRGEGLELQGVLVMGLGDVGEITIEKVRAGVAAAALRYAFRVLNGARQQPEGRWLSANFSTLLVGTYSFGTALSVPASVAAIVQGVIEANRTLKAQNLWNSVRIDALEIIERYEDVAIQAISTVDSLLKRPPLELAQDEALELTPAYLRAKPGSQPQRPAGQYSPDQWDQVRIESKLPDGILAMEQAGQVLTDAQKAEKTLKFTLMSDRARVEDTSLATQRQLVDKFVTAAVNRRDYDEKLGLTLFELLVPNSFKDQVGFRDKLLLTVDQDSAQYPWELMAQRTRSGIRPLAKEKGMIRKLSTANFRPNPQAARSNCALVIGDPLLTDARFPQLAGAKAEADLVAGALSGNYQVKALTDKPDAMAIISALFEEDYRIIHLAGHGFYDPANPINSGMVLSTGCHLTSAELQQLRSVPELVFINCCFLGRVDQGAEGGLKLEAHKLAASISQELIKMGVRAVVAAGWAVDDNAAQTFAQIFYDGMLHNKTFGDAVKDARQAVFSRHRQTNTWGAYQCYGDPNYRLYQDKDPRREWKTAATFFSERQVHDELHRIISQADDQKRNADLLDSLERVCLSIPPHWLNGAMLGLLGEAWSKLGDFEKGIDYYERALQDANATVTLRQVLDLANLKGRYAVHLSQQSGRQASSRSKKNTGKTLSPANLFKDATDLLEKMLQLQETGDLLAKLGGHYKRWARMERDDKLCLARIRDAKIWYERAQKKRLEETGQLDPYPALNRITCEMLSGGQSQKMRRLFDEMKTIKEVVWQMKDAEDLWQRVHYPDALLLEHLLSRKLGKTGIKDQIIAAYRSALKVGTNEQQRDSVRAQFDFLIEMIERNAGQLKALNAQVEELRDIRNSIGTGNQKGKS